jgi:hypothetical protein
MIQMFSTNKHNIDFVDLMSFFNREYDFILDRAVNEYNTTCNLINREKMYFNEISYTKLVVHFRFIHILSKYTDDNIQLKAQQILFELKETEKKLNCFVDNIYYLLDDDNEISIVKTRNIVI